MCCLVLKMQAPRQSGESAPINAIPGKKCDVFPISASSLRRLISPVTSFSADQAQPVCHASISTIRSLRQMSPCKAHSRSCGQRRCSRTWTAGQSAASRM